MTNVFELFDDPVAVCGCGNDRWFIRIEMLRAGYSLVKGFVCTSCKFRIDLKGDDSCRIVRVSL